MSSSPHASHTDAELRYRALFNSLDQGYCTIEVAFDEHDRPTDYRFVEVSPSFARHTGIEHGAGRWMREIAPDQDEYWFQIYGRVSLTGEPARFEERSTPLGRWWSVYAFRIEDHPGGCIGVLFNDITDRKRAEQSLHESDERQRFLLRLTDSLRFISDPARIMDVAAQMFGQRLGLATVQYLVVGPDGDEYEVAATYSDGRLPRLPHERGRISEHAPGWEARFRAGEEMFSDDYTARQAHAMACEAFGVRSGSVVPLVKDGCLVAAFTTAHPEPRHWTAGEKALQREVAERTWASTQRARAEQALVASEEKYRKLFDSIDEGVSTMEVLFDGDGKAVDFRFLQINAAHERKSGLGHDVIGKRIREVMPAIEDTIIERVGHVALTGDTIRVQEYVRSLDRWFDVYLSRVGGSGSRIVASVFNDITGAKRTEANLAFLSEVSQDLVRLANIDDVMDALGAKIGRYLQVGRCVFCEVDEAGDKVRMTHDWHCPELTSAVGELTLSRMVGEEFRAMCRAGHVIAIDDVRHTALVEPGQIEAVFDVSSFIYVPILRDGQWRFALVVHNVAPRRWRDDEIDLLREITSRLLTRLERVRTEDTVRASEARLRLLIESVKDYAIFTLDPAGHVTSWNEGAHRLVGFTADEILGQSVSRFYRPEEIAAGMPAREIQQALRAGRSEVESWRVRKDGSAFWANEIMTPLHGGDGRHLGFVKISRDLTERKAFENALGQARAELEERVRERTADLEQANRSLRAEVSERRAAEEQIRTLFERLVSVQEEERRRIARDIHDQLGQQMTALRMNLAAAHVWLEGQPARLEQAHRTQQLAEELDRSIDFLTWELRPASLDHFGLPAALDSLVSGWSERFGIDAEFDASGAESLRLPRDTEANIYRVAQEALHNVVKHANATAVSVLLQHRNGEVVLVVADDGEGFSLAEAQERSAAGGFGLVSMRERAVLVGATLRIDTSPGRGTTILVTIPMKRSTDRTRSVE
jgi:PAS domain S-box-containing protein